MSDHEQPGPINRGPRDPRREAARGRAQRQRRLTAAAGVIVLVASSWALASRLRSDDTPPTPPPASVAAVTTAETSSTPDVAATTAATPTPVPVISKAAPKPAPPPPAGAAIVRDFIPYSTARKTQMAGYSLRHYGIDSSALDPKVIVLHFTESNDYRSAWNAFAGNAPAPGPGGSKAESPGTCAHYIVDQAGTIHQLVPLTLQCRHAIGLNRWAIGIEMVQTSTGHDSHWADQQILGRPAQIGAVLTLVRSLQRQFGIPKTSVLGHATANQSPRFLDLQGWKNDHTDWQAEDVLEVRRRL